MSDAKKKVGRPKKIRPEPPPVTAKMTDFFSLPSMADQFVYIPNGALVSGTAINRLFNDVGAAAALTRTRCCMSTIWMPGAPRVITDMMVTAGDATLLPRLGEKTFNLYIAPPTLPKIEEGVDLVEAVKPWLDLGKKIWSEEDLRHIITCLAFKLQHPEVKINHALMVGSTCQGIGKDSFLLPATMAAGTWNCKNATASEMMDPKFDAQLATVFLVINETHDLQDRRFTYYRMSKVWKAAPPDTLRVADKNIRRHAVWNCVFIIEHTNELLGMHLDGDDRRNYVAWSLTTRGDFGTPDQYEEYFRDYRTWRDKQGGAERIAQYLATLDVSSFDPGAPPPRTAAWHQIVAAGQDTEQHGELADVMDSLRWPRAVTLDQLTTAAAAIGANGLLAVLNGVNKRAIPHRLLTVKYSQVTNPDAEDGQWKIEGKRKAVYAPDKLTGKARIAAATSLTDSGRTARRAVVAALIAAKVDPLA